MESFETFINIFRRALAEKNHFDLRNILENGPKYFQNISKSDSESVLAELFDDGNGLLYFLHLELSRSKSVKVFEQAVKEGFDFLRFVIDHFRDAISKNILYIINIKEICMLALVTSCSYFIKKSVACTFNKCLDLFRKECNFEEEVKKLTSYLEKLDIKERSIVLLVLGGISKYHPEAIRSCGKFRFMFHYLQGDFKKKYNANSENQPPEIEMYLYTLSDMMVELSNDIPERCVPEIYSWVKRLSCAPVDQKKQTIMKAAISLLSQHMYNFSNFVYRDYEYWHSLFNKLVKDKTKENDFAFIALKKFYQFIGDVLKDKSSESDRAIFMYFKENFEKVLKENSHESSTFLFIVYGYSQMAAPCKKYLTDSDVRNMFSIVAQSANSIFFMESLTKEDLERIYYYQEAYSNIILQLNTLSLNELSILTKLCTLLIKTFPDLPITSQKHATMSLKKTIANIDSAHKYCINEFLHNIIYEGVKWTCSHTLFIDAELQHELKNLKERPLCYKNYIPLWAELFKIRSDSSYNDCCIARNTMEAAIKVCIELLNKLNLNTRIKTNCVFTDATVSETAENADDFRIFINMIDLYVDIFDRVSHTLLMGSIDQLIREIVKMSYRNPLISGFYKIARKCCNRIDEMSEEEFRSESQILLYNYLMNVLHSISTLSGELLTTCLYLILDMPLTFVHRLLNDTVPVFQIALTVGLSDFDLAYTALNTLEKWTNHLEKSVITDFLKKIISTLEPHLQSEENIAEFSQDIIKGTRKVVKRMQFIDSEKTLANFQRRILLFIASLDTDIVIDFVHKRSMETGATWDKKNLLKCSLPLSDVKVDLYLDRILPQTIMLAQNSGHRQKKVVACESLHMMATFLLGRTSESLASNPEQYLTLYKKLCPTLLKLGSDTDEVARQIFQPLMIQLTHWLSSRFMQQSPITIYFLDSCFDGLCCESNSALREFSGLCLAEFTQWSIKQSNEVESNSNINAVISKIRNFALHPSFAKCMAAAVALNNLYTILREEEDIVSMYWLELFYCFIKSLPHCNDRATYNAIDHILRVLVAKEFLLNRVNPRRRKPHEFTNATLTDGVQWLLVQCGSLDECCRKKCMELYKQVAICANDCNSANDAIKKYIDDKGIEAFNDIILNGTSAKLNDLATEKILPLLRSFDCYIWLIKESLIDPELLFGNGNPYRTLIFDATKNFIQLIVMSETENLKVFYKVIVTMFDFLQTLFQLNENYIPEFVLINELCLLISAFIMCPVIDVNADNFKILNTCPSIAVNLINSIIQKTNSTLPISMKNELEKRIDKHLNEWYQLNTIIQGVVPAELNQYIRGLSTLEQNSVLQKLDLDKRILDPREEKLREIFNILLQETIGELVYTNINPSGMDYLRNLMDLILMRYEKSVTRTLISLIADSTMPAVSNLPHGLHFLSMFRDVIFRYLLKDIEKTFDVFINSLEENPSLLLNVVEDLMLFVQRHKKSLHEVTEKLANIVTNNFTAFERALNNIEERRDKFINIFGIVAKLKDKPTELIVINLEFHRWILHQLIGSFDITYKIRILQNFLPCLVDTTVTDKRELVVILHRLVLDETQKNTDHSGVSLKEVNSFQTLLSLLPVTQSVIVLESIILSVACWYEQLYNEKTKKFLNLYFNNISNEHVLLSLERAYIVFMDINRPVKERFDILHKFLRSSFEFCKSTHIERFFEKNINEIWNTVRRSLVGNDTDVKQDIVSKIGSYDLLAIMFAKVPLSAIATKESTITRNITDDHAKTEKGLFLLIFSNVIRIRELKTVNPDHRELMRLLHCSAYNCSIAMVSFKNDQQLYAKVFTETRNPDYLIWTNIVDCNRKYNLQQLFNDNPKYRQKLINIRKKLRNEQKTPQRYYVHTYDIGSSTLNEDINVNDFNEFSVSTKPIEGEEKDEEDKSMSLTFECDELNEHECMASICGILIHIVSQDANPSNSNNSSAVPLWMERICVSMQRATHNNVRLFLLKIVANVPSVFAPYADLCMPIILSKIYQYLTENPLNYIITDVLLNLIEWHISETIQRRIHITAQKLWELLIHKVATVNATTSKSIYKFNMSIIKSLLQVWKIFLKIPRNLTDIMKNSPKTAVYVVRICMEYGMENQIVEDDVLMEFLTTSLDDLQHQEDTFLQMSECWGLILEFLSKDEKYANKLCALQDTIQNFFRNIQRRRDGRLIRYIYAISRYYPKAATIYYIFVSANIVMVDNQDKAKCLEIFLQRVKGFNADEGKKEVSFLRLEDFLKNKIQPCENVSLRIIHALTTVLNPKDLLPLANLAVPYVKNPSIEFRKIVYSIFMTIYTKYLSGSSDSSYARELTHLSKEVLLSGILDPADELQKDILTFWTQNAGFSSSCKNRLLEVLDTYTPNNEDAFLPFISIMVLDLTAKSLDYTQSMFKPLHECCYIDYRISALWRTKSSMAPLFVPSLASELNQTLTQMTTSQSSLGSYSSYATFSRSQFGNKQLKIRATQEPEFQPTIVTQTQVLSSRDVTSDKSEVEIIRQPAYAKKSPRFLKDTSQLVSGIRQAHIKVNIQRDEMMKEEISRQRSSVKVYRNYRLGDFPDIEISLSTMTESLLQLIKRDQSICKDIFVSVCCFLLRNIADEDYIGKITEKLKSIISQHPKNQSITSAILEIFISAQIYEISPDTVMKAARSGGLNFHGALMLEESLICAPENILSPTKKLRTDTINNPCNKWVQLTSLYESIKDTDIVLSIFQNHIEDENMEQAAVAQATNDWLKAKDAYSKALELGTEPIKEYSLQGLFECSKNLCSWSEIDKRIKETLNDDLNNIWNHPWKDWMFPWLFEVQTQKLLQFNNGSGDPKLSEISESDFNLATSWVTDKSKQEYLKCFFGEEIAMLFLFCKKSDFALEYLAVSIDEMRRKWIRLNPLSTELRLHTLQKLRKLNDINIYSKLTKNTSCDASLPGIQSLLKFWNTSVPSMQDFILLWDQLTSYRLFLMCFLEERLSPADDTQDSTYTFTRTSIPEKLKLIPFNLQLNMTKAAINQRNIFIAEKYLQQAKKRIQILSDHCKDEFSLTFAKTKSFEGVVQSDVNKKMECFTISWDRLHNLVARDKLETVINVAAWQQISEISLNLTKTARQNEVFAQLLLKNQNILSPINTSSADIANVLNALEKYSLQQLKECCITRDSVSIKNCYFALAKYCYDKLLSDSQDVDIQKEFVRSTLKGMSYGSMEAAHYFPCLLKLEYFKDKDTREIFETESKTVETWMFLSWQAQLFSHLGTELAYLVTPILEKIANLYPNAIIYSLSFVMELNSVLLTDQRTYGIRKIFYEMPQAEQFLKAMEYVVQPELYLHYHLQQFKENLSQGKATAVEALLKKVYPSQRELKTQPRPGGIYKEIGKFEKEIKSLSNKKDSDIIKWIDITCRNLKEHLSKRFSKRSFDGNVKLKDYSPWLSQYEGNDLEIPGQYTGKRKPLPQYHTKIAKFDALAKVMQSLRKPIRITIIGNDAKDYNFLIKFGEDLRLDQRLQQLFSIMNKTLELDVICKQRQLSIETYEVIPLSKSLGLIQWIDDTKCLQNLIDFTLSPKRLEDYKCIRIDYANWIHSAAPAAKQHLQYKEALIRYKAPQVIEKMKEFINRTDWDSLRNTFKILCPSVEGFMTLRQNFVTSYATMSIAQWILGIGDRHLENTLVVISSGKCLGIDFGLAFDAGIDLPVPELLPFRLTPQILGLLKPFTEKDLFATIMTHVLRAFRSEQGPILACLEVFVHEPLNWTGAVDKSLKEEGIAQPETKWLPQKKINTVRQKLKGIKPTESTLDQLYKQNNEKYYERYCRIVRGDDDVKCPRSKMTNDSLSVEDQILCLLDQATDLNVLGRMYEGWKPWL